MKNTESINMQADEKQPNPNDSKTIKYGCIIFCLLSAFMIGVIINIVVTGVRTVNEIIPYTDDKPITIPEEKGTENEVKEVNEKINKFTKKLNSIESTTAELKLTVKELNVLIANNTYLSDLKGAYFFKSISSDGIIKLVCSRKIRKFVPWKDRRYWNGEMELFLEAMEGRVFLRVKNLNPANGSQMPKKIIEKWASQDQLEMYKNDDNFSNYTKKINSARFENNAVILSTKNSSKE